MKFKVSAYRRDAVVKVKEVSRSPRSGIDDIAVYTSVAQIASYVKGIERMPILLISVQSVLPFMIAIRVGYGIS